MCFNVLQVAVSRWWLVLQTEQSGWFVRNIEESVLSSPGVDERGPALRWQMADNKAALTSEMGYSVRKVNAQM
jgi:hypothetical protein